MTFSGCEYAYLDGKNIHLSTDNDDDILNSLITENDEILKCIKNLKSNKACSDYDIIKEYIKATAHEMVPLRGTFEKYVHVAWSNISVTG